MRILRVLIPFTILLVGVILLVGWFRNDNALVSASSQTPQPSAHPVIQPLRVCLDAGHGGSDPGTSDTQGKRLEKNDTLALTLAVYEYLQQKNIDVFLTREDDSYPTLPERCAMANNKEATLFVALHRNSGGGAGVEVWVASEPETEVVYFSETVLEALEICGIQRNRGVRRGTPGNPTSDFILNSDTDMPSCVIEMGFMDNEEDNRLFDEHFDEYAKAIADCITAMGEET